MLDGFFSLIGFGMSLLTMRVARLVRQPDDQWFHFGYARFEPLLNLLKGIVILGVCGLSLASAIQALLHGGRELNLGPAVIYSILAPFRAPRAQAGARLEQELHRSEAGDKQIAAEAAQ